MRNVLIDQRLYRKQVYNTHGYGNAAKQHSQEIPAARPHYCNPGLPDLYQPFYPAFALTMAETLNASIARVRIALLQSQLV